MNAAAAARQDRSLFAMSLACTALVFIVVAASAWLRLASPACPPGGCEGFVFADAVRLAHRVAAMGVTVLALVIAALAWKAPARPGRRAASVVIIVLVAVLAVVGRQSAGSPAPAVVLTNLLGGLTLLGFTMAMAVIAQRNDSRLSTYFVAALGIHVVATVTGGLVTMAASSPEAMLFLAHRAASGVALAAWILLAISATQSAGVRLAAGIAFALVGAQVILAVLATPAPTVDWLHNLLTATGLCAAITASFSSRVPSGGDRGLARRQPAGS